MTTTYLIAANVAVWLGLCGYVAFLAVRLAGLERSLKRFAALRGNEEVQS